MMLIRRLKLLLRLQYKKQTCITGPTELLLKWGGGAENTFLGVANGKSVTRRDAKTGPRRKSVVTWWKSKYVTDIHKIWESKTH